VQPNLPPCGDLKATSFDGSLAVTGRVVRPDRVRQWDALRSIDADEVLTVRGGGYSYAPASLRSEGLHVDTSTWDRILSFDRSSGVMVVEGGVTLWDVHLVASPAGWHLPSQPGYPAITVGGCLAADTHGKNQHRSGNFRHCVRSIDLWHPDHGTRRLLPADPVFDLTVGGLGLTGVVLAAELQLEPLPSATVEVTATTIRDAGDTSGVLRSHAGSLYSFTWQDFTRRRAVGRGVAYSAEFVGSASHDGGVTRFARIGPDRSPFPVNLMHRPTIRLMNASLQVAAWATHGRRTVDLIDFLFPAARRATYFRLFGRQGFIETQVLVPDASATSFLEQVGRAARRRGAPVSLGSCKLFAGESSLLRFDGTGVVLALDVPRSASGCEFVTDVHSAMLDAGGRPNIVKDSLLTRETVDRSVAGIDEFRTRLAEYDPKRRFRSAISDRLGL
jgi:decaprenylphospho-beta-D-ribofuranose 2-oxidase